MLGQQLGVEYFAELRCGCIYEPMIRELLRGALHVRRKIKGIEIGARRWHEDRARRSEQKLK
jgi:hypothetical protein